MKRLVSVVLLASATTFSSFADADVGPPPRSDCPIGGTRCWIDGKLEGTCVDGTCRRGVVASASAVPSSTAAPSASTGTSPSSGGCSVPGSENPADRWLAGVALVGAALVSRKLRRPR